MGLLIGYPAGQVGANPADELILKLPDPVGDVDQVVWDLPNGEPPYLDPRNSLDFSNGQVAANMCEPLLVMAPDRSVHPNLAEYEQVSDTKVVLHLRSDVTFWDGTPMTADDVVYSMTRAKEPDSSARFGLRNVETITKTGANEVTLSLSRPDVLLKPGLASSGGRIVQKAFTEKVGKEFGTPAGGLMCTGPFQLGTWDSGNSLTMTRYDGYWNKDRRPFAKTVKFVFVTDATATAQALNSGEIDGTYQIPLAAMQTLQNSPAGKLYRGPSTESINLTVATPGGQLADLNLRNALMNLINREAIAKVVYFGAATPKYTMLTPATWPADQKAKYEKAYEGFVKARGYDLEKAKKLVEASKYDGSPLILALQSGDSEGTKVAQIIQQEAGKIGVKIEIKEMQPVAFSQAGTDATYREGLDLMYTSNFDLRPDPLEPFGYGMPGEAYNYTDWDSPEATEIFKKARATYDNAERADLTIRLQELIEEDAATIPIVSTDARTFLSNDLTGAVTSFAYWPMQQMAYVGAAK